MPGFIEPCNPKTGAIPTGTEWDYEVKLDGYRLQAHLTERTITLFTRRGYDWTSRFPQLATHLRGGLPATSAILDGEVVALDSEARPDFSALESAIHAGRTAGLIYFVYDLLYLDGHDLRHLGLRLRRDTLRDVIGSGNEHLKFSDNLHQDGATLFQAACQMQLEGIVSKRVDAPYRSGDSDSWIKTKCRRSDNFPIIAFVEKLGARPRRIASLYLGRRENGKLLYAGKAQTGFKTEDLYYLRERLDPYIINASALDEPIKKPKATWVEPALDAEVHYSAMTEAGRLRAPIYKGLREDLAPRRLEPPAIKPSKRTSSRGAVPRENILQLLPNADPPTPEALADYWSRVHGRALAYLARRPLKLVRHVRGTTFYHKGPLPPVPRAVHQLTVTKRSGGEGRRLWVEDLEGLLGLTEIGAVELHPWNATVDDIERADTMVIDLDPGSGIEGSFIVDTALTLRELLHQEGFECWPKLTGGKGIHVMIPLETPISHDASHRRSREIAEHLASLDPDRLTLSAAFAARRGRLFIDYLRNGRGTTAVGTFSPRARPTHPIAAPTTWEAIAAGIRPDRFTMEDLPPTSRKKSTRKRSP
jgi:bifunctional non-homologous end joining protein LigD